MEVYRHVWRNWNRRLILVLCSKGVRLVFCDWLCGGQRLPGLRWVGVRRGASSSQRMLGMQRDWKARHVCCDTMHALRGVRLVNTRPETGRQSRIGGPPFKVAFPFGLRC